MIKKMIKKMTPEKYDIKDFYYGAVCTISEPYEKYIKEIGFTTLVHSIGPLEYTLLLNQKGKWIDLRHTERKFYIPRDGEESSYIVEKKFPFEEYCKALGVYNTHWTIREVCNFFKDNLNFFYFYTYTLQQKMELEESFLDGSTLIRAKEIFKR